MKVMCSCDGDTHLFNTMDNDDKTKSYFYQCNICKLVTLIEVDLS